MTATVTKPRTPAKINFANIPTELTLLRQWCVWKYAIRDGNETKIPYQVNGVEAKTNTPNTWTTFDNVVQAFNRGGFDGIGFVFCANDPYTGIDLDGCRNPVTGVIEPWAQFWIDLFSSYIRNCSIQHSTFLTGANSAGSDTTSTWHQSNVPRLLRRSKVSHMTETTLLVL